jgi:hypothetical protein
MCSLWIVNYKHKFIIAINFFFLLLAVFIFILNKLPFKWYKILTMLCTWKGVYIHRNSICSLLQVFCIITCSFSVFVDNCILLPMRYKWICCVPVYCTCMVLIFYPFTEIFIISNKGTIFSKNKNSVSECIFIFMYKNIASKSFYQNKIHPFPLMLMQRNEVWYTYTPLGI